MKNEEADRIADTSVRIGMIIGLMLGVSEEACEYLIANKSKDFRYSREAKVVLDARKAYLSVK